MESTVRQTVESSAIKILAMGEAGDGRKTRRHKTTRGRSRGHVWNSEYSALSSLSGPRTRVSGEAMRSAVPISNRCASQPSYLEVVSFIAGTKARLLTDSMEELPGYSGFRT
jgi:hypothetical protein